MNTKESSTKGFISSLMILYLLTTLAIVGVVTDKIIKTDKTLINLKDYKDNFYYERASILTLKEYLIGLKEYDEALEQYQEKLIEYNEKKDIENEEIEEPLEPEEYQNLDIIYIDDEVVFYKFLDDFVEIYLKDQIIEVSIRNYQIMAYRYV